MYPVASSPIGWRLTFNPYSIKQIYSRHSKSCYFSEKIRLHFMWISCLADNSYFLWKTKEEFQYFKVSSAVMIITRQMIHIKYQVLYFLWIFFFFFFKALSGFVAISTSMIYMLSIFQAMSPDGEAIVTGAGDETLRFWNVFSKTRSTKVSLR